MDLAKKRSKNNIEAKAIKRIHILFVVLLFLTIVIKILGAYLLSTEDVVFQEQSFEEIVFKEAEEEVKIKDLNSIRVDLNDLDEKIKDMFAKGKNDVNINRRAYEVAYSLWEKEYDNLYASISSNMSKTSQKDLVKEKDSFLSYKKLQSEKASKHSEAEGLSMYSYYKTNYELTRKEVYEMLDRYGRYLDTSMN